MDGIPYLLLEMYLRCHRGATFSEELISYMCRWHLVMSGLQKWNPQHFHSKHQCISIEDCFLDMIWIQTSLEGVQDHL